MLYVKNAHIIIYKANVNQGMLIENLRFFKNFISLYLSETLSAILYFQFKGITFEILTNSGKMSFVSLIKNEVSLDLTKIYESQRNIH